MKLLLLGTFLILSLILNGCGATNVQPTAYKENSTSSTQTSPSTSAPSASSPNAAPGAVPAPAPAPLQSSAPSIPAKPAPMHPTGTAINQGESLYNAQCMSCHRINDLKGNHLSLNYIQAHMPPREAGSLTTQQASDLVAYISSTQK